MSTLPLALSDEEVEAQVSVWRLTAADGGGYPLYLDEYPIDWVRECIKRYGRVLSDTTKHQHWCRSIDPSLLEGRPVPIDSTCPDFYQCKCPKF